MAHFAISAIGRDRPGIVAAVSAALLRHGANVEDSQMTILRGHFTMTLVVAAPADADVDALRDDMRAAGEELGLEAISVAAVGEGGGAHTGSEPSHIVTVYGVDHPGIVHAVAAALAGAGVNITDLNTRLVAGEGESTRSGEGSVHGGQAAGPGEDAARASGGTEGGGENLYAMMLEVALPAGMGEETLDALLDAVRREQGVEVSVRELERDVL
jgi:glycine cleavage system transcriptional repressor